MVLTLVNMVTRTSMTVRLTPTMLSKYSVWNKVETKEMTTRIKVGRNTVSIMFCSRRTRTNSTMTNVCSESLGSSSEKILVLETRYCFSSSRPLYSTLFGISFTNLDEMAFGFKTI